MTDTTEISTIDWAGLELVYDSATCPGVIIDMECYLAEDYCGTVGCLLGWFAHYNPDDSFKIHLMSPRRCALERFGLDDEQVSYLFFHDRNNEAVSRLRKFIDTKGSYDT